MPCDQRNLLPNSAQMTARDLHPPCSALLTVRACVRVRMPSQRIEHGYRAIPDVDVCPDSCWWLDEWRHSDVAYVAYVHDLDLQAIERASEHGGYNKLKPAQTCAKKSGGGVCGAG